MSAHRELTPGEVLAARARAIACTRARRTGIPHHAEQLPHRLDTALGTRDGAQPWLVRVADRATNDQWLAAAKRGNRSTLVRHGLPHPEEAKAP